MQRGGPIFRCAAVAVVLLGLAGCADQRVAGAEADGHQAMVAGHPEVAVRAYGAALARAQADGDASAMATAGTDLAIAELAANHPDAALTDGRHLEAELARRGHKPPATLGLVIATALYRQGQLAEAATAAKGVADSPDQAVATRGQFLVGLIAAAQHDTEGVLASSLVLSAQHDSASVADTTELDAILAMARGDHAAARTQALAAVKQRYALDDPRGAARCEALAAEAAQALGARQQAAGLYLRAGQGEAAIGNNARARTVLTQARTLATDAGTRDAATTALAALGG